VKQSRWNRVVGKRIILSWLLNVIVCVCVCACVRARERERNHKVHCRIRANTVWIFSSISTTVFWRMSQPCSVTYDIELPLIHWHALEEFERIQPWFTIVWVINRHVYNMSWIKVCLGNYKQNKHRTDDLWALKAAALVMFWKEWGHSEDVVAGIPEHCWRTYDAVRC